MGIYNITLKTLHIGKEKYSCFLRGSVDSKYGK